MTYALKIAALEEAIASGELTVESDGERVTYRTVAEMLKAIDYLRGQDRAQITPGTPRPRTTVAVYDPS